MFERKVIPLISVQEVVKSIKNSYKTNNRGYVTHITDNYVLELVNFEKNI